MKILFITGSLNQGGAEFQLLQLAKLFMENGHAIEVFAITDHDFYLPYVKEHKIPYNHLQNNQGKLKRIHQTITKIRNYKPDLIISYLKIVSKVAIIAKLFSGLKVPIVVGERTSLIQPAKDWIHFNILRFSNAVTVNSVSRFDQLKKDFPWLHNKLYFFPNIIALDNYNFEKVRKDSNKFSLGYIGRIAPEKNILNLLKAIQLLASKKYDITLSITGAAKHTRYYEEVKTYIKEHNLERNILIQGKSNNVIEVYREIDLLCLVSNYEGFSNVLSEALASGIPIITSNIKENTYLVEDTINGYVVNHKDPQSIAEGIIKFINLNEAEKQQMSFNNKRKAKILFDKEMLYKKYMSLIDTLKN